MKHPVYGLEKPYLQNIGEELSSYADEIFLDGFSNLVAIKQGKKKTVVSFSASENAFLINQILPDGKAGFSPLFEIPESLSNERVLSPNAQQGRLDAKAKTVTFATKDELKPGDVIYINPTCEAFADFYITNQIPYFLAQMFTAYFKQGTAPISVAFLREKQKGSHALGIHYPADEAYFVTCVENLPHEFCFVKKEGDFVSTFDIPTLPTAVCKDSVSTANSYYLSGGCDKVATLALRMKKLPNGNFQIKKEAVKQLFAFLESLK
ncbi:MAG: hypothetical protein IKW04_06180 [Clostridia bacterium]|nr:hypothetical protein [Clostridia bacterium]